MEEFIHKNSKLLVFSLLGLILIGFGVLAYKIDIFSSGDTVEVLPASPSDGSQGGNALEIIVEVGGAVEKTGVYKMKMGDRIDDLLIISGGLSGDADRDWVNKNINRASKLIDGQKTYIYSQSEVASARKEGGYPPAVGQVKPDQGVLGITGSDPAGLTNINTASQLELEKLVGIGPVYAKNIIEHRPYSMIEDLVKKGVIPTKTFEKIKTQIAVN